MIEEADIETWPFRYWSSPCSARGTG